MARIKSREARTSKPATRPKTAATSSRGKRAARRASWQAVAKAPARRCSEDQVRERAYYIYLERRGAPGDALGDWLRAEQELNSSAGSIRG